MLPKLNSHDPVSIQQNKQKQINKLPIENFRLFNQKPKTILPKDAINQKKQITQKQNQVNLQLMPKSFKINKQLFGQQPNSESINLFTKKDKYRLQKNKCKILKQKFNNFSKDSLHRSDFCTLNIDNYLNIDRSVQISDIHFSQARNTIQKCNHLSKKNTICQKRKFNRNKKFQNYLIQRQRNHCHAQSFTFGKYHEHLKNQEDQKITTLSYNRINHLKKIKYFLCEKDQQQDEFLDEQRYKTQISQNAQLAIENVKNKLKKQKAADYQKIRYINQRIHSISSHKSIQISKNGKLSRSIQKLQSQKRPKGISHNINSTQLKNQKYIEQHLQTKQETLSNSKLEKSLQNLDLTKDNINLNKQNSKMKSVCKQEKQKLRDLINIDIYNSFNRKKQEKNKYAFKQSKQNFFRLSQKQIKLSKNKDKKKSKRYRVQKDKGSKLDQGITFQDRFRKDVTKDSDYMNKHINKFKI